MACHVSFQENKSLTDKIASFELVDVRAATKNVIGPHKNDGFGWVFIFDLLQIFVQLFNYRSTERKDVITSTNVSSFYTFL